MTDETLPEIPVIDVADDDAPSLGTAEAAEDRLEALVAAAEAHYGRRFIAVADRMTRRWARRNTTPYLDEIGSFADRLPVPGGWFLNISFEWSCTCGVHADPASGAMRMLRVLDWPLSGLGRSLVAAHQAGPAGRFLNLTWPGFAGVVTGIARGRFAAAINQAPLPNRGLGCWGDWATSRLGIWRSREMPPMHLLRQVFEHCLSYEDARRALIHAPLAVSAIFTLVGPRPGEGCIIERKPHEAWVHPAPAAAANHWLSPDLRGRSRSASSPDRHNQMMALLEERPADGLDWLTPPIRNRMTRLAATLDPAEGRVLAQGFEEDGPATRPLALEI